MTDVFLRQAMTTSTTNHPGKSHMTIAPQLSLEWSTPGEVQALAPILAAARPAPVTKATPRPKAPAMLDRTGRKRTVATMPGHRAGQAPVTKGRKYPPDPVTAEDVDAMLKYLDKPRGRSENRHGEMSRLRLRALIAVLWRSGLRISEALDLEQRDLNRDDYCLTVRNGKGGKRRISAMDEWGWAELARWQDVRSALPIGPVFCVLSGVTSGRSWASSDVRRQLKNTATGAGVSRRVAPHQFRHAHAVDLWRDGIDVFVVQRQLGHARLDVTAHYLSGVAPVELLEPIGRRRAPLMPVAHAETGARR